MSKNHKVLVLIYLHAIKCKMKVDFKQPLQDQKESFLILHHLNQIQVA